MKYLFKPTKNMRGKASIQYNTIEDAIHCACSAMNGCHTCPFYSIGQAVKSKCLVDNHSLWTKDNLKRLGIREVV